MKTKAAILTSAVVILAAIGLWELLRRPAAPKAADGPIIIFSIDTLRADHLPAYGYNTIQTPNLDRFAADGVLFENAYSHSPQTLPSHMSLLSGRLPFEHAVRDNIGFTAKPGERFLQQAVKERGFATGGFVSAYVLRRETGINQGFDHYDDQLPPASPDRPVGQVQRPGADTVAAAIQWIDQQPSSKFFAFVHIYEPHRPYTPPERFKTPLPYDGEVEYADEIFGQFVEHLRQKDLYDRAAIVLLSDHGEGLGDHGEQDHGIFLYRDTIHVPLVVKLPGVIGGRRIASPVQLLDVAPTILALAGGDRLAPASRVHGRSLVPVLTQRGDLPATSIYSESLSPRYHFGWSELYALTDDRYRLIRAPRDELYDIQQDPGERTSIADARPQARQALRRALDDIIANATVDAPAAVTAEDRQKLAALGYVGTQTGSTLKLPGDQLPDPKDKVGVLEKYRRATQLAGERRFLDAAALYRELLRDEPAMTDVWLQLAETYSRVGMSAAALDAYREIIKRNPKDAAALTGAATALLRLGRADEARAHAELAAAVTPAAGHELLAQIAISSKDVDTARREARLAQEADPSLPMRPFIEGQILHRQGRYAAAIPYFEEASRALEARTVQIADVYYYLGDSLARVERYQEAERAFRAELRVLPVHVRARAGLAMLYRAQGRDAESDREIAELTRLSPTREGYDVAAQLWTMFGDPARAAAAREASRRVSR